ncbi:MAG: NUDIX hydrolase [Anaerolineales bacterium]|uniref:NUDIX hydrolase n=1 Tax=Candidatus Villigracilis vicinus TaxID=3140679 RepID=UPI001B586F34|nr:NUDIX hydrolase [Anaerolineales bacterium]MBP6179477.1 NUDIX hydrolase [Anaerolineales bacterium]MBP6210443.1 NUDIX hydrolase [Anaerolineales bacterium]
MKKVLINNQQIVFNDFFKLEDALVSFEKFNGEMSEPARRLSLERGDSVAVLVFNQTTQKLILINQFRYPTYKNGDGWIIETIAGMIDKEESAETAAKREVEEEVGLNINSMEFISTFYLSPGGSSERIHLYFSEVSGEDANYKGFGGMITEGEDIKVEEMSLNEALHGIKSGKIVDAKTILGIYWLKNRQLEK